ncbi:MAG TPA: amidohydrolase [Chthonomonadales bacterium]|nr:amidohydrolase [Chthonomonadales bacterium]
MKVDALLNRATVLEPGDGFRRDRAIAIAEGRISAVVAQADAQALTSPATRVFDLAGRAVAPGFHDAHMHVLPFGVWASQADLSAEAGVTSPEGLATALRAWVDRHPASPWALGNRYDQNVFPGGRHPSRHDLDRAAPTRPAFALQTSAHAGCANTAALRLAGVTRNTPDPEGGHIVRDEAGEPTGVLLESATALVTRHIPRPTRAEMAAALGYAHEVLLRRGVTSACDMLTGWYDIEDELSAYRDAAASRPGVRVTLCPGAARFGGPGALPDRADFARAAGLAAGDAPVRLGALKLFADGALTARTAALRMPYADGSGSGMLLLERDELADWVRAAHRGGWGVAVHAIGDRAIEAVLDAIEAAPQPPHEARDRIEHAMVMDGDLVSRVRALGVTLVMQPEFISLLGDGYLVALGSERAERLAPVADLLQAGIEVAFSSDCPVVPGDPLDGVRAALRRTTISGRTLGPSQRVGLTAALHAYTHAGARAVGDEAHTGRVARGMRADLVVLDGDLGDSGASDLRVAATMLGGEWVWGEEALA